MMTLFYILDLRWASFGVDFEYEDLPKETRKYIHNLVESVGGKMSPKWVYVVELVRELPLNKLWDDE